MVSETACKTVFLVVTAFGLDGVGWEVVDVAVVAALVLDVLGEGVLDVVAVDGLVFGRVADRWQSCLFDLVALLFGCCRRVGGGIGAGS